MAIYLKKFENHTQYEEARQNLILPNVSLCVNENEVHYNPYVPSRMNIITYRATEKLPETTSNKTSGLHTNAFNTTIKSHTFENGVGTIEFNDDVTTVGNYAFYQCSSLTSIVIPSGVTSIGSFAFDSCRGLTSIDIPNSVTSIGSAAFSSCSGLTSCTIGTGVTSIGDTAFTYCYSLTSIDIPDSVTNIGHSAFQNCTGLTSCTIGNGVTNIDIQAFQGCSGLTSVTIGSGVTIIDVQAFAYCYSLTSIVCNATKAPGIQSSTFRDVHTGGTLTVPSGSTGYNVWMGTGNYYLGLYNWTKVEQ